MENAMKSAGGQSGFSLLEVLVAMFILMIGLLSIATGFTQVLVLMANTPVQLAAKELADEIIDDIAVQRNAGVLDLVGLLGNSRENILHRRNYANRNGDFDVGNKVFHENTTANLNPDGNLNVDVVITYWPAGLGIGDINAPSARRYAVNTTIN